MRKKILIGCLLLSCGAYSQVGVNVPLPLAAFHVDGSKNNPVGVAPSVDDAKDDFVITKEGKVGLGTFTPEATLDINGKIRMIDGKQADSKVMMSDVNGNLKWETIGYIVPTVIGAFEQGYVKSNEAGTYIYSRGYITLTKGRWVVNAGLTIGFDIGSDIWMHAYLSSSKTAKAQVGFKLTGAAGVNTAYASRIKVPAGNYASLSGSSVVDVTADTVTLYLLIEKISTWDFYASSLENYFYAIPML